MDDKTGPRKAGECVACGEPMELSPEGLSIHKCSDEAERKANRRRHRGRGLGQRLAEGFSMLEASEAGD